MYVPPCGVSCTKNLNMEATDVHSVITEVFAHQVDLSRFQDWLIQC